MIRLGPRQLGAVGGFALGWLIVQHGLFAAAFVLLLALGGWFLGRVLEGEVDLARLVRPPGDRDLE